MKLYTRIFLSFLFLMAQVGTANAQTQSEVSTETVRQIEEQLKVQFDQEFLVSVYHKIKSPDWKIRMGYLDPAGSLDESYIFLASAFQPAEDENPNGFIGVFKSGKIVWHSERIINTDNVVNAGLLGVRDLDQNGRVEIITEWYIGMRGGNTDLWIYTWNGNTGQRINQLAEEGKSAIEATEASVEFVDIEPDGTKEILGLNRESELNVYSWNGQEYGNSGASLPSRLPRDAAKIQIRAEVTNPQDNNKLRFQYFLNNKTNSLQSIEKLAIKNFSIAPEKVTSPKDWEFNPHLKNMLVSWQVELFLEQHRDALLEPGKSDSSFSFTTIGLPRPAIYYAQGNNGDLSNDADDLINNSVTGFTLGPYNPPNPFDTVAFTDSLQTYVSESCSLEWITNRGICKSLGSKLDNARRQLERGNIKSATNNVQTLLDEVEAVRRNHLTSEAYGLLYYNGQFLLDKLEE